MLVQWDERGRQESDGNDRQILYQEVFSSVGLRKSQLICPVFVRQGTNLGSKKKISSMPGISATPVADVVNHAQSIIGYGINSIIIFGIPEKRDRDGHCAADPNGIVQTAARILRQTFGNSLNIITDVCLCQYNFSGHCGVIRGGKPGSNKTFSTIDNDATLGVLAEVAASHADAGADMVAPSSMMDGQVRSLRESLDERGFGETRILSYSAKHASSLYTPFRSVAFSDKVGIMDIDKSSYQIPYTSQRQVLREIEADINEGADMVMVKPALAYLDLVSAIKDRFDFPLAVQNVSGEYAMIKAAARQGWIHEDDWKVSSIASMRRAGADRIISYFALDIARYL